MILGNSSSGPWAISPLCKYVGVAKTHRSAFVIDAASFRVDSLVLRTVDSVILGGFSLKRFQSAMDLGECDAHVSLFASTHVVLKAAPPPRSPVTFPCSVSD